MDGFSMDDRVCWTFFNTARVYTSQFTIRYALVCTVTCSLPLLGNDLQRQTLPLLWALELSTDSGTRFLHQQLTATEP
jgi:hypothetical protein